MRYAFYGCYFFGLILLALSLAAALSTHFLPGGCSGWPRSFPRNFIPITRSIFPKIKLLGIPRPAS